MNHQPIFASTHEMLAAAINARNLGRKGKTTAMTAMSETLMLFNEVKRLREALQQIVGFLPHDTIQAETMPDVTVQGALDLLHFTGKFAQAALDGDPLPTIFVDCFFDANSPAPPDSDRGA